MPHIPDQTYENLLDLLNTVVNTPDGTWEYRRQRLLAIASTDDRSALHEFAAWFPEETE